MTKILTYPNAIVGLGDGGAQSSSTAAMATPRGCWENGCGSGRF